MSCTRRNHGLYWVRYPRIRWTRLVLCLILLSSSTTTIQAAYPTPPPTTTPCDCPLLSYIFRLDFSLPCVRSSQHNTSSCIVEPVLGSSSNQDKLRPIQLSLIQVLELGHSSWNNDLIVLEQTEYSVENAVPFMSDGSFFAYTPSNGTATTTTFPVVGLQLNMVGINQDRQALVLGSALLFEPSPSNCPSFPRLPAGTQLGWAHVVHVSESSSDRCSGTWSRLIC